MLSGPGKARINVATGSWVPHNMSHLHKVYMFIWLSGLFIKL